VSEVPSIKGSVLAGHAEALQKYLASASLDPAVLEARFRPGELELLAGPIQSVGWYDVGTYQRVLEFLRDYPGGGDNEYLIASGRRTAESLIRAGRYQQMDYLRRTQHRGKDDPHERFIAFGRDLRLLCSITQSILNFAHTEVKPDPEHPDRWMQELHTTAAYPEVLCWSTQGFSNRMAEEHGAPDLWRWERPHPELVLFRMTYAL
jgi:hypothetical protein